MPTQLEYASYLVFNFVASVGVIFVNKHIFTAFSFEYTTLLTAMHYVVTLVGLEILASCGAYERRWSPTTPRMLLLSAVVGTAPALNNLSLSLNNLGFYQVVKLMVTPAIVTLEAYLYGKCLTVPRALALLLVCVGVALAVVNDVSINLRGFTAACMWVPAAAFYKVLWSRVSKEESWHVFALMRRVLPLSTAFLLCLVPIIDPPGAFGGGNGVGFKWTLERALMIALSGIAAFFVNWSGFLVMGACSALTHTVLGQVKAVCTIIGGWLIFQQVYPTKAIAGALVAITAMVLYTKYTLDQSGAASGDSSGAKQRNPPEPQSIGCRAKVEDLTSDGEGEGELEGQAPADASEGSPLMSRTLDRRV